MSRVYLALYLRMKTGLSNSAIPLILRPASLFLAITWAVFWDVYVSAELPQPGGHSTDTLTVNFLVGERLGRRWTIWFAMVWVLVGTTLQTSAFHVAHLVVGRIITGVGTGLKTSTVPT